MVNIQIPVPSNDLYPILKCVVKGDKKQYPVIKEEKTGAEFFITRTFYGTYVGFFGSNETLDWKTNLCYFQRTVPKNEWDYPGICIHSGYYKSYIKLRPKLYTKLTTYLPCTEPVIVVGYSMGGGLASLCAFDIAVSYSLFCIDVHCITLGSPRTLNKKGSMLFSSRVNIKRVKYGNDLITKLPPPIGFYHVGEKYHIGTTEHFYKACKQDHYQYKQEDVLHKIASDLCVSV